ncbi:MAG TPA: methyltransferase domain-containing protein [Rhodothermales bacterium]|nr:methyltransferase domain-containing protein [Rhodothermales bacterium]
MFGNLVSKDDLPLLVEKLRQGQGPKSLRLLAAFTAKQRVDRTWEIIESPPKHWGSLEAIQRRWNLLATGDPSVTAYDHVASRYLADRDDRVALSIACGTGVHEVRWARTGRFARIDGFDVSPERIEAARERALLEELSDVVHFNVADLRKLDVPPSSYDVVIAINALHHVSPLEPVIQWIGRLLKPEGLIVLRDYVGPDRFQWTPLQLKAADELLAKIPLRYRIRWGSGSVKKRNYRAGRLAMMFSDPSEAAESSRILPLLDGAFEQVERRNLGGTILHLVLKDIAHHFSTGDPKAEAWLERMMLAEDELLANGEVESDFVFGVWRNTERGAGRAD